MGHIQIGQVNLITCKLWLKHLFYPVGVHVNHHIPSNALRILVCHHTLFFLVPTAFTTRTNILILSGLRSPTVHLTFAEPRETHTTGFRPTVGLPIIVGTKVQKIFDTCLFFYEKLKKPQFFLLFQNDNFSSFLHHPSYIKHHPSYIIHLP